MNMKPKEEDGEGEITSQQESKPSNTKKSPTEKRNKMEVRNPVAEIHCMEGLGAPELAMIKRLAGNDSDVRKKTIKKLRKWLSSIASKLPNSSVEDCRSIIEPNFIRVWKALFYCMWMADKPLPQEQLAEQLSGLVGVFKNKPAALLLFIEWFFRTMAREWPWIDRFRMDKFMMLMRRFLRSSFKQLYEEYKFNNEVLDPFLEIISVFIFNRFPLLGKKTRAQLKAPDPIRAPLGLQNHLADIFMEELAKVCGDNLKSKKLLRILKPFIHELTVNDDERLTNQIMERVFNYLMRQSDVGIDFQEEMQGNNGIDDSDDDDEEEMDQDENAEGDEEDNEENMDQDLDEMVMEKASTGNGPLDPRAGAVDVVLPQLDVDYAELAAALTKAGGGKDVRKKNRKWLYGLARGYQEIVEGKYPLAVPRDNSTAAEKRAIKSHDINSAAVHLLRLDEEIIAENAKAKAKRKKQKKGKNNNLQELNESSSKVSDLSLNTSEETSAYLNDDELFEHVDDNYMSYLEEMKELDEQNNKSLEDEADGKKKKKKLKRKKSQAAAVIDTNGKVEEETEEVINTKKIKLKSVDDESSLSPRSKAARRKARRSSNGLMHDKANEATSASPTKTTIEDEPSNNSPTLSPSPKSAQRLNNKKISANGMLRTPLSKQAQILTPKSVTSSGGLKKRVSFVMARNLEHPHADYKKSILRSPAIPFDAERQPNVGLLKSKSPATTPTNNSATKKKKKISPIPFRARAIDYF